jgi:DNA replicative helicase MCM subunit Mcm2 (Cdc46/Mcm family)
MDMGGIGMRGDKRVLVVLSPEEMEKISTLKEQLHEAHQKLHYTHSRAASIDAAVRLIRDYRKSIMDKDIDKSLEVVILMMAESVRLVNEAQRIIASIHQIPEVSEDDKA